MPYAPSYQWTEESLALLGTMTDYDVAQTLGVTQGVVFNQRAIRGIPPFRPVGRHKAGRKSYPWTPEELALLGTMSDQDVANKLDISYGTVQRKRKELGIPAMDSSRERIDWTEEKIALLGTAPDWVVAEKLGIHKLTVLHKRHELGIVAYGKYSKPITNPVEETQTVLQASPAQLVVLTEAERKLLLSILVGLDEIGMLSDKPNFKSIVNSAKP